MSDLSPVQPGASDLPTTRQITAELRRLVAARLGVPVVRVRLNTPLADLAVDSFVLVETVVDLQETYGVRFDRSDLDRARTIRQLAALVVERREADRAP